MATKVELDRPEKNRLGWYVGVKDDYFRYLHGDGVVRDGAGYGECNTGYFPTEAAAQEAIAKYQATQEAAHNG